MPLFRSLNGVRDWVGENRSILDPAGRRSPGWWRSSTTSSPRSAGRASSASPGALGWIFGGWRLTVLVTAGFASLGALGLWDASMATLSLMLAAVLIALIIGLPLGILAGRSNRVSAVLSPILDVMQIMPTLSYLIPVTALFFIGAAPSTVATLIYAIPPAIRITVARDPRRAADDDGGGPVARLDRAAGPDARSRSRSPAGRSASGSTRRSCWPCRWS